MTDLPVTPGAETQQPTPNDEGLATPDVATGSSSDVDHGAGADDRAQQKASAADFAKEHDPAAHDIAAGEESRQRGDWTADEAGGAQVWDAEGNLVEGTSPTEPAAGQGTSDDEAAAVSGSAESRTHRRTSSLDEVRDGGYSVGSAALIEDGAMPLGHPIKAWNDAKTFVTPDDDGYDDAVPDLWFTDDAAAQRAGFRTTD